jgi:hypothetical protein
MGAVNATVYADRVDLVEVSPWAHRHNLLVAEAFDRDGRRLAARVASWVSNTEAVYLHGVGEAAAMLAAVRAALADADPPVVVRDSGRAEDHIVGDVPVAGGKVVRPADEAAVVAGMPPEGVSAPGADPQDARPLIGKAMPSVEDSAGTTHAHHAGGKRLRTPDEPAGDAAPAAEDEDEARTVAELQDELRARDLPVSGTKPELQQRLRDNPA